MAALPDTVRTTDLYERYAPRIFGYCLQRLGNREEAEDAVQTTFLNAFRGLSRGVVPAAEGAWLFKIAENVCLSRHRASFRRRRIEALGDLRVVEETDAGSGLAALKGALSTGAVVKAVVTTAAVTGLTVGMVVDPPQLRRHDAPKPSAPVVPAKGSVAPTPQVIADVPSALSSV